MKKLNFLLSALIFMLCAPLFLNAQNMGNYDENWYIDYVGERVSVTSPASLAGPVTYTIANDGGGGANEWGQSIRALGSPILNVDVVKADPYEACVTLTNGASLSGKIALVKRGNCEFGAKAKAAQDAGAVACIIVNNVSGGPVGMGKGAVGGQVTIPVIMVSDVDGAAIEAMVDAPGVKVSMTSWGNGFNNDLGILTNGVALSHAYSIPLAQIKNTSSEAFKNLGAAVIGNFGTTTATNVVLKSTLSWTPDGGSTSVVREDSTTVASFAPGDSIISPIIDQTYGLTATTTGRYDIKYEVKAGNWPDDFPGDNVQEASFYVKRQLYSKGRYDFTNNHALSNISYTVVNSQNNTQGDFTWGPFYYLEKPDYYFERATFGLTISGGGDMSSTGEVLIWIWEWNDQSGDSVVQAGEINIVGVGKKVYGTGDTSGQRFTVEIKDAYDETKKLSNKANTWYWVTCTVPTNTYINCDGQSNYFVRSWARFHASSKAYDAYAPMYSANYQALLNEDPSQLMQHFPFARFYFNVDSTRYSQQKSGMVPSIPLEMSLWTVDVDDVQKEKSSFNVGLYPNPATDVINVSVELDEDADKIHYVVMDGIGARVTETTHEQVSGSDTYSVSTDKLAAGNYYMMIDVDDKIKVRKFTVVK